MGLAHTFDNGCGGVGDYVDDTPEAAGPNWGCPTGTDSCPDDGQGDDLIDNFMDYSYNYCMDSFTQGQFDRMQLMWDTYRNTANGNTCYSPISGNCVLPAPIPAPVADPTFAPTPMPSAGPTPSPVSVTDPATQTFNAIDSDGDGSININEFKVYYNLARYITCPHANTCPV
jgi:hypothetical protein